MSSWNYTPAWRVSWLAGRMETLLLELLLFKIVSRAYPLSLARVKLEEGVEGDLFRHGRSEEENSDCSYEI